MGQHELVKSIQVAISRLLNPFIFITLCDTFPRIQDALLKNNTTYHSFYALDARWYKKLFNYSYANVSLTVSCEALRAGRALATVARSSVKINQAKIPLMP